MPQPSAARKTIAAIGAMLWLANAPCAHATVYPYELTDVTFSDGGTATGTFSLQGAYMDTWDVVTSGDAGYSYLPTINAGISGDTMTVSLNRASYVGSVTFVFEYPLDDPSTFAYGLDPIVGGEECGAYTCTALNDRTLTGGDAQFVPEPMSLALLGGAALGLAAARRQRVSSSS